MVSEIQPNHHDSSIHHQNLSTYRHLRKSFLCLIFYWTNLPISSTSKQTSVIMTENAESSSFEAAEICIALRHPRLLKTSADSIRRFMRKYDQHATVILAHANQLSTTTLTSEAAKLFNHKFWIEVQFLEPAIALGCLPDVTTYEEAIDVQICVFRESLCDNSKEIVTLEQLDKLVQQKLSTRVWIIIPSKHACKFCLPAATICFRVMVWKE